MLKFPAKSRKDLHLYWVKTVLECLQWDEAYKEAPGAVRAQGSRSGGIFLYIILSNLLLATIRKGERMARKE